MPFICKQPRWAEWNNHVKYTEVNSGMEHLLLQWLPGWMLVKAGFEGETEIKALGKNKKTPAR